MLAWLEMFGLFALLYVGIPYAGLRIDRVLDLPPLPIIVRGLGLILLSVGVAVLAWCFALFSRVGRGTPNPAMPPESLVTIGPYAWSRNPIALGHATALIGLSLFLGSTFAPVIVVVLAFPVHLAMLHEERTLEARFGDAYRLYKASVPRWMPRPWKR